MNEKNPNSSAVVEIWVGIDVAKETFDVAYRQPSALSFESVSSLSFESSSFKRNANGVKLFVEWVKKILSGLKTNGQNENSLKVRLVMESTGNYSLELAFMISEVYPECLFSIVDPKKVYAFGKSLKMRNKTDKSDAQILALYGEERKPSAFVPESKEYLTLKALVRQRRALVKALTIAKLQREEPCEVKEVVKSRDKLIRDIASNIKKIEEVIKKHLEAHAELNETVKSLEKIDGIGFVTAVTVVGELGDLKRFSSSKKISAYCGLSPKVFESGKSVKMKTRLCKEGNSEIRKVLYLATLAAINGDNGFSRFYNSLTSKGKSKMSAICAVMRKMICVIRAVANSKDHMYIEGLVSPQKT